MLASKGKRVLQPQNESPPKRVSNLQTQNANEGGAFEWNKRCVICGKKKDKNQRHAMIDISEVSRSKIKNAAELTSNESLLILLKCAEEMGENSFVQKYHHLCYRTLTSDLLVTRKLSPRSENTLPSHIAAKAVLDELRPSLQSGNVFFLKEVGQKFQEKMSEISESYSKVTVRTNRVKEWISTVSDGSITFHSLGPGKSDIMCRSDLPLSSIMEYCSVGPEEGGAFDFGTIRKPGIADENQERACLFQAATILRREIDSIPATTQYPAPEECMLQNSMQFIPDTILSFFKKIINSEVDLDHTSTESTLRMAATLSESLIYCSRRKKRNQVIPPFHIGLAAQIMHEDGEKRRIEELHSYGLCVSYDELRKFETTAAEEELKGSAEIYVPKAIVPIQEGGLLIQEGDDNIDIAVQTIDGKNTCHFMGRAVYQMQTPEQKKPMDSLHRKQRRSLDLKKSEMPQFQLTYFQKPSKNPEPECFPNSLTTLENLRTSINSFRNKDIMWVLLRGVSRGLMIFSNGAPMKQIIPFWTGFNTRTGSFERRVTTTSYLPSIDARPADVYTVYTTLKRGKAMAEECGQKFHIHTFDQQLYAVALQVVLSLRHEFPPSTTVLRLGGFHTACTMIACVGKLWGDAGLRDMLADSGVYAGGTVDQMLKGKQFHRAVRGLTIVYEVLLTLLLENFQAWLLEESPETIDSMMEIVTNAYDAYNNKSREDEMTNLSAFIETLMPLFVKFVDVGRGNIPTFSFWYDCLFAIHILLCQIRAEREGDWNAHLAATAAMLPFFFVCNRNKYSKFATYYVLDMSNNLPADVQTAFIDGQHSIRFSAGAFRGLFSDIAVEMTIVRDSKDHRSGIIGFSRKEKAVLLWGLTRVTLARYTKSMRDRSGHADSESQEGCTSHEQELPSCLSRDDQHVRGVLDFVKTSMSDPFSASGRGDCLIHIGNGPIATKPIENSLVNAIKNGTKQMERFTQERLQTDPSCRKVKFYDVLHNSDIKTFSDMQKPTPMRINGVSVLKVISPEIVFQRALEVKELRTEAIDLKEVLSYPLTSVPSSLFKADGTQRTPQCKADQVRELEHEILSPADECNSNSLLQDSVCYTKPDTEGTHVIRIVDAMAVLQKLNTKDMKTFCDVGMHFVKITLEMLNICDELHLVFDRYDDEFCPKDIDRRRRYPSAAAHPYEIGSGRPLPSWDRIMSSNVNKAGLTNFLSEYLSSNLGKHLPPEKSVVLGGGFKSRLVAKLIEDEVCEEVQLFACNHSEADTRMVFHAIHATNVMWKPCTVFVESPDTDVFILLVAHYSRFKEGTKLWFQTGATQKITDRHRYIPVHRTAVQLEKSYPYMCSALPSIHALTGCDTVSAIYYIGKKIAFQAATAMTPDERFNLSAFGEGHETSCRAATKFVSLLYDTKSKLEEYHHSINLMRTKLSLNRGTADRLPPSKPAFDEHLLRGIWQVYYWNYAHVGKVAFKDPLQHGWCQRDGILQPVFFKGPTCLEFLQKFYCSCTSKSSCSSARHCPCNELRLECCGLCTCFKDCSKNKSATGK